MATFRCKCNTLLRDDDPDFGKYLFSRRDYDVDVESAELLGRAREVWECPVCGRLWVFWQTGTAHPTEYVPAAGSGEGSVDF
jgi:hypothetical protein